MIDVENAALDALERFGAGTAKYLKCDSVKLVDELTETYEWGWVFYFAPDGTSEPTSTKTCAAAYEKATRKMVPVGTKGLRFAIEQFQKMQ
ncbi:hypothetical protein GC197_18445 [bacterium]|nr:hypothetical protein [bacterium]